MPLFVLCSSLRNMNAYFILITNACFSTFMNKYYMMKATKSIVLDEELGDVSYLNLKIYLKECFKKSYLAIKEVKYTFLYFWPIINNKKLYFCNVWNVLKVFLEKILNISNATRNETLLKRPKGLN